MSSLSLSLSVCVCVCPLYTVRSMPLTAAHGSLVLPPHAGSDAVALQIAQQYVGEFGKLAKAGNAMLIPANTNDVGGMVAQALGVFNMLRGGKVGVGGYE
jgi:hypothetical protein